MKLKLLAVSLSAFALAFMTSCGNSEKVVSDNHQGPAWQSTEKNFSINQIRDLALIYQGGSQRIP